MAVSIVSNKPRTSVVIHVSNGSSGSIRVTGNNAVSNIASPGETLTGAYLTQAIWGIDPSGYIVIKRHTTPIAVYDSTGQHEYAGAGMPITVGQAEANLSVEFVGTSNGFIIFELQKVGPTLTANSEYFQI
ncbi:hypothetical protein UFOVP447_41 [uncultured Caudovirales phage]|uniref:Uncharacterized protein n=1 Tax=uncultured Caudovirales phage TaxID=2100421 RepID=A0A6J5M7Y6_9CAUD|nr:hypothetical protein UFOVP447_41 [uncultured Caudovirales phage]